MLNSLAGCTAVTGWIVARTGGVPACGGAVARVAGKEMQGAGDRVHGDLVFDVADHGSVGGVVVPAVELGGEATGAVFVLLTCEAGIPAQCW